MGGCPTLAENPVKTRSGVSSASLNKLRIHSLRVKKARRFIEERTGPFGNSGVNKMGWSEELIGFIVSEHEKYGEPFGSYYMYSFAYSWSNFGLSIGTVAKFGNKYSWWCYGPFDVTSTVPSDRIKACSDLHSGGWHKSLLENPKINDRCHVMETYYFYTKGYKGLASVFAVYAPSRPRDYNFKTVRGHRMGRIERAYNEFVQCIKRGYAVGKL